MDSSFKSEAKNTFWFLLKQFFLFMFFIGVFRTIFVVYYYDKLQVVEDPFMEILKAYYNAISLDVATASILVVIPWLLLSINSLLKLKIIKSVLYVYTLIVIVLSTSVYIAELGIYNEWEEKPTFKIFNYLKNPDEILNSNPLFYTIILTIILVLVLTIFFKLTKKLYEGYTISRPRNFIVAAIFFFLMPWLIFLGARGGWKSIPISQSSVYFSNYQVYNDIAISTVYNFIHSITENQDILDGKNRYLIKLDEDKKKNILKELMATDANCSSMDICLRIC